MRIATVVSAAAIALVAHVGTSSAGDSFSTLNGTKADPLTSSEMAAVQGTARLVGFGTFSVAKRAASSGRNPQTGEPIHIPASRQPKFKAGKGLKAAVN